MTNLLTVQTLAGTCVLAKRKYLLYTRKYLLYQYPDVFSAILQRSYIRQCLPCAGIVIPESIVKLERDVLQEPIDAVVDAENGFLQSMLG